MALIQFTNVSFSYLRNVPVLHHISFSIEKTERVMLVGTIGAGKSTMLKLAVGLLSPDNGTVIVDGINPSRNPLHEIARRIGVALQNPSDQIFSITVREEIIYGLHNLGVQETSHTLHRIADLFHLTDVLDKHPYDLHPAQRRLLALASTIAMNTPFCIFDEPTSGVSKPERKLISAALDQQTTAGKGYLLITHDLAFGMEQCDRILVLNKGIIAVDEAVPDFLRRPDAQGILKANGMQMPIVPRMSATLAQENIAVLLPDFLSQLPGKHNENTL